MFARFSPGRQAFERPLARIRQLPPFLEHGVDVEVALQPFELRQRAATSRTFPMRSLVTMSALVAIGQVTQITYY
jgi:hypothetical protein